VSCLPITFGDHEGGGQSEVDEVEVVQVIIILILADKNVVRLQVIVDKANRMDLL